MRPMINSCGLLLMLSPLVLFSSASYVQAQLVHPSVQKVNDELDNLAGITPRDRYHETALAESQMILLEALEKPVVQIRPFLQDERAWALFMEEYYLAVMDYFRWIITSPTSTFQQKQKAVADFQKANLQRGQWTTVAASLGRAI